MRPEPLYQEYQFESRPRHKILLTALIFWEGERIEMALYSAQDGNHEVS